MSNEQTNIRLRAARIQQNMTVVALSEKSGVSRPTIFAYEKNPEHSLKPETIASLETALGIQHAQRSRRELAAEIEKFALQATQTKTRAEFDALTAIGTELQAEIPATDNFDRARIMLDLATLSRRFRQFPQAIRYAEEARTIYLAERERVGATRGLYEVAASEYEARYYHAAAGKFMLVESEAAAIGDADMQAKATVSAALCFAQVGDAAMLADYTNRAAERVESIDVSQRVWFDVTADYLRAEAFMQAGSFGFATQAYANAAIRYEAMQDYTNAYKMRYDVAYALYKAGRYEEALTEANYTSDRACREDFCDEVMTSRADILLSKIYSRKGDFDNALEYLLAFLESPNLHAPETLARAYRAAAYAHLGKGDETAFLAHLEQAIITLQGETSEESLRLAAKITQEYLMRRTPLVGLQR